MRTAVLGGRFAALSSSALLGVIAGIGIGAMTGWSGGEVFASAALLVYLGVEAPKVGLFGRTVLGIALAVAAAAVAVLPHPARTVIHGLGEAASLAGLFAAVGFLREAAESSRLVRDCGILMVNQPPGRRYLVLTLGSQLISVVLNFGVLPLLGTMVMGANSAEAAGGDLRIVAIRQQRMMTALLRGFAVMTVWSPLSVSFAVTQSVVHDVPWERLLPQQIVLAFLLMVLGWHLDRVAFDRAPPRSCAPAGGWGPLVRLGLLIGAVVAAAVAVAVVLGVPVVTSTVLAVPAAALVWLAVQHRRQGVAGAVAAAGELLARRLRVSLPGFRNEIALLGGAMFLGSVASALIAPELAAGRLAMLGVPPVVLAILLAWSVMGLARFGVPQILTVSLLGGAFADPGRPGPDSLVLASGLMGAWALSACTTPVGAAILSVSRLSGVPMQTIARDWNGRFVRLGGLLLGLWMLCLHGIFGTG